MPMLLSGKRVLDSKLQKYNKMRQSSWNMSVAGFIFLFLNFRTLPDLIV